MENNNIISKEEAGKLIAESEQRAYNTAKQECISVRVLCNGAAGMLKYMHNVYKEVAKNEYGIAYNTNSYYTSEPAIAHLRLFQEYLEPLKCVEELCTLDDNDSNIMIISLKIHGDNPDFRKRFNEHYYFRKNIEVLTERLANKKGADKAFIIASWLMEKANCIPDENVSAETIFKGEAIAHLSSLISACENYSNIFGIENSECNVALQKVIKKHQSITNSKPLD